MTTAHGFEFDRVAKGPNLTIRSIFASLARAAMKALDQALIWQERARQRRHLAALSPHMLKDLGLSRADVERESSRPFWRP